VAHAVVTLRDVDGRRPALTAATDDDGRFEFSSLLAGRYELVATKPSFLASELGAGQPERIGTPIVLAEGQRLRGLPVQLHPGSVLTGTVWSADGLLVPRARIAALRMRYVAGGSRKPVVEGQVSTDDRGRFRLYGLPPGEYVVVALPGVRSGGGADVGTSRVSTPVFLPGTLYFDAAARIVVTAGEEHGNLDLRLPRVTTVDLSGFTTLADPEWLKDLSLQIVLAPRDEPVRTLARRLLSAPPGGSFGIAEVAPGGYQVTVSATRRGASSGTPPQWRGETTVAVMSGTIPPTVIVALRRAPAVSGVVEFDATTSRLKPDPAAIRVSLKTDAALADVADNWETRVGGDGRFHFPGVPAGRYVIAGRLLGAPSHWTLRSAFLRGQPLSDRTFDASVDDVTRPAADGTFDLRGISPGEYAVAVLEDLHPDDLHDLSLLGRMIAAAAMSTAFARGERKRQDLRVR
jgi:hypothetical protein